MKEVVCMHIGQAGVQMGNAIWELICTEHGINEAGHMQVTQRQTECLETFFSLSHSERFIPRSIFVDLEASVIDEVRTGTYKHLFHPDRLITGPEDAASNFARGFFTVGKLLLGVISHELKKLLESGDNTIAIFIFRSLGGGTGSGLTSAIFDTLADYGKLVKIEMPIYPSPTLSTAMVEPYNCLLSEHFCMEDIDVGLLLDNEALYDICSKYLCLFHPTYSTINRLISQLVSSITASVRFESVLNCDITVLQTNLVPYPRIHFPLANFAPVLSASKAMHEEMTITDITKAVFEKENQMMKIDHSFGRFMSCSLLYRGEISPCHVYGALSIIKKDKNIEFVDWCPTGFKVGINVCPPTSIPASQIFQSSKNVTMLANTSAIGQAWQRITHKFYLLYSKRSFVHWFVGEGMEECEFTESLYNISALVKDYEEVTMDREVEEESGAVETPAKDDKREQSNTAFAETSKQSIKSKESIKKSIKQEEHFAKEDVINEDIVEAKKSMKNEDNNAEDETANEEQIEASLEIAQHSNEEKSAEEIAEEENAEETNAEEVVDDGNAEEEAVEEEIAEEENADEENADEENADEENADEENADEEIEEEENDEEENANAVESEDGSNFDETNQNCNVLIHAAATNNYGESSEQSFDCCTINDNTLDNIRISMIDDEHATKEFYSSHI